MRVLLGDDDPVTHVGILAAAVRAGCEVVGHATTGAGLLRLAEELSPDVVVIDLAIAGDVGLETLADRLVPPWVEHVVVRGDWPALPRIDLDRTWVLDDRDPRHLTAVLQTLRQRLELG